LGPVRLQTVQAFELYPTFKDVHAYKSETLCHTLLLRIPQRRGHCNALKDLWHLQSGIVPNMVSSVNDDPVLPVLCALHETWLHAMRFDFVWHTEPIFTPLGVEVNK
jgi:hypothetical protein